MSESESEMLQDAPTPTIKVAVDKLLPPSKSSTVYEAAYQRFIKWCTEKDINNYSEDVLLEYFSEMANNKKMKSSSLWSQYSMVKSLLNRYVPKKARVLTKDQLDKFLTDAPDEKYLGIKVILILGISGSCRCDDLVKLKIEDIEDFGSSLLVRIPDSKTHKMRSFSVIGEEYISKYRKYVSLRPPGMDEQRFFLKYQNGVCCRMVMGIHKIGGAAKEVASYLKLPNWEEYTGHCLRQTPATLLIDRKPDVTCLKQHQEWKSSSVAEEYAEESLHDEKDLDMKFLFSNESNESSNEPNYSSCDSSKSTSDPLVIMNEIINADISSVAASGLFQNANISNCTINLYFTSRQSGEKS
ncbi:hypothetical protein ILUMI_25160 [Ignelater luminosus]|uniref:Tyr recombinase domain-containing protein n=1 Tax=Ignelater luminosus TaxID=2038154 RepID=A0A8K0C929_IGNLU|nr:hypothetical protein ILUMI_25160 [Ignelater luminosus]